MSVSQDSIGLRSAMGAGLLPCMSYGCWGAATALWRRPQPNQDVVIFTPSIVQYQLLEPV